MEYLSHGVVLDGILMPPLCRQQELDFIKKKMELTQDDVIVATYPKTGTTWLGYLAALIQAKGDTATVNQANINEWMPFIENHHGQPIRDKLASMTSPRLLKTHLPFEKLKRVCEVYRPKVLSIIRNPKDMLVSFYHFHRMNKHIGLYEGSWDDFFEGFSKKGLLYGDYLDHVTGWYDAINTGKINALQVKYEDLVFDLEGGVTQIAKFLGKALTREEVSDIVKAATFDAMKENPSVNFSENAVMDFYISPFMRRGEVGDWKNYFSEEQNEYLDIFYTQRFEEAGITFTFE